MENRIVYCNTKRFEGDDAVRTRLTLDFADVTEKDLVEYAIDALVIKWQSSIRRKKDEKVPTEATYKVPKPGTRAAATTTPFDALCIIAGSKELALKLVNKAGSVEKALALFKAIIDEETDTIE
jgi:hypothetical protein